MNKESLVKEVAEQAEITKADASQAIDVIFDAIQDSLAKGDPVSLVGFGSFKISKRNARAGRHPRTGEPLSIPETMVPSFSAGKTLKDAVNEKGQDS
jgi:DNA-binding protein HU-beta